VPEAAGTVFNTPDDGCCDTQNMQSSVAVNKYLHNVASVGFLFTLNYDARNHKLKILSFLDSNMVKKCKIFQQSTKTHTTCQTNSAEQSPS